MTTAGAARQRHRVEQPTWCLCPVGLRALPRSAPLVAGTQGDGAASHTQQQGEGGR